MEVINTTKLLTGYTMGVEPSAREWLVLAIKGTFTLPEPGAEPALADEQVPLVFADTFTGEPGFSAPLDEVDFALHKPRCDVLMTGSAWAPDGRPAERVAVGVRVGRWMKSFAVSGDRQWSSSLVATRVTRPVPFVRKAISYDNAFGGVDTAHEDPDKHGAFTRNPVGRGWHRQLAAKYIDGAPLPDAEQLDRPVERPDGDYAPMAFGPLGRGWSPRLALAGTYDQDWLDNTFPFLPADFRDDYYQAAPADQQIAYPQGGEEVTLVNLSAAGRLSFKLPAIDLPLVFFRAGGGHVETRAVLDTIVFQPDDHRFTLTWRASVALKKNMLEISQALVGTMSSGWWRARALGKAWYPSLAHLPGLQAGAHRALP